MVKGLIEMKEHERPSQFMIETSDPRYMEKHRQEILGFVARMNNYRKPTIWDRFSRAWAAFRDNRP